MFGFTDPDVDIDKLTASIKAHEGLRLTAYKDTTGHYSIGYGRNLINEGISRDEAEFMLGNDIQLCLRTVKAQPFWDNIKDNDARIRAFVEILFNLGLGGLSYFRRALEAAERNDWDTCANELLDSLWHAQVGKRAEVLAQMVKTGID